MFGKTIMMKYLLPLGLAAAIGGGAVSLALAESNQNQSSSHPAMILEVNSKGKILLRGTVESVASSTLTLKSWGGTWTIKTSSDTKIHPKANGTSTLSAFEKGDFVGVTGQVSETENFTVNAKIVRNWTEKKETKKREGRVYVGTAGTVASSSLILNSKAKLYTIYVASSTKVLNRLWLNINLNDILRGDRVRVYGAASGTDIQAEVVRDISLP